MTLARDEVLSILRDVETRLHAPVWLSGGVGVDFLVGRWTRPHADVDLIAYEHDRTQLKDELRRIEFLCTFDRRWHTRWSRAGDVGGELQVDFVSGESDGTPVLIACPDDPLGLPPGRYPGAREDLAPDRYAELDGIRLRVVSAGVQWILRMSYRLLRPSADDDARVAHDLALLEPLIPQAERAQLARRVASRRPLEPGDC